MHTHTWGRNSSQNIFLLDFWGSYICQGHNYCLPLQPFLHKGLGKILEKLVNYFERKIPEQLGLGKAPLEGMGLGSYFCCDGGGEELLMV